VKKPSKRRSARHRHYGYRYGRDPFYFAHPRFWWPFRPPRYRYYRQYRRPYHGRIFIFRW